MRNFIKPFLDLIDDNWLRDHILNLYRIERKQTFPAYETAAKYVYDLLKSEGFESEYLEFPADGKTTYQDKCMPIGWDVSKMKLTLLTNVPGISDPVISDYELEPLMAVKGSVSTPPEGIKTIIRTENQMKAGEDVRGCLVLLNQCNRPRKEVMKYLLDCGAIGWVSDFLEDPNTNPDSVAWINAATENNSWHIQAEDRDFIGFQITPRTGYYLRAMCERTTVSVKIESDARRYESVLPAVTALLPGEDKREIWVVSHLYEPLIDDNSNGVIGSIAILKALRDSGVKLKYSVRVVFASEMYGFAAVAEHFGGDLSSRVIGAINTDGTVSTYGERMPKKFRSYEAPDYPGFAGNILLRMVDNQFKEEYSEMVVHEYDHQLGDDCFLSDSSIGANVVWLYCENKGFHHNSTQKEEMFDLGITKCHLSYHFSWIYAMATLTEDEVCELLPFALERANKNLEAAAKIDVRSGTDEKARLEFLYNRECEKIKNLSLWGSESDIAKIIPEIKKPESSANFCDVEGKWYSYADNFIFTRKGRGFPHDLVKLPYNKRRQMPGTILYNKISDIYSRIDGKHTLRELIDIVEYDRGIIFKDSELKSYITTLTMLSDAGYLDMVEKNPLTADDLARAIKELGINEGDTVLVHSAPSSIGYLKDSPSSIIEALRKALGYDGTFLAPAFARCYVSFPGTLTKYLGSLPYDRRENGEYRDKSIWTGSVPKAMLKEPDSFRSNHPTHEWVAIGKDAKELTSGHGFFDSPTGATSPLPKVLKKGGSILFIGSCRGSNTFLHYIEEITEAPFLEPLAFSYITESGKLRLGYIENHLPGHRNFYNGFDNEFYDKAFAKGLKIHKVPFGNEYLCRIDMREFYEIAMEIFKEDSCATLCKDPDCFYCRQYRK